MVQVVHASGPRSCGFELQNGSNLFSLSMVHSSILLSKMFPEDLNTTRHVKVKPVLVF